MIDFNNLKEVYFIGEIGINHNGELQNAKRLIDAVHACGWNCAKFQKRNPDTCVPPSQKQIMRDTPWGRMSYIDYKKKIEFQSKEYNYIDKYCREKPVDWTASVWDIDSLNFIAKYNPPFIKVASALVVDKDLLKEICLTNIPIMFSTGMCELSDVDAAVNIVSKYTDNFVLMHTNSSYPSPLNELNLNLIQFYKNRYQCPVGYSGHEYGIEPTVIACSLGANIIERHITLSQDMWGTDQKSSIEIKGMSLLIGRINDLPLIMGDTKKTITQSEIAIKKKLRK